MEGTTNKTEKLKVGGGGKGPSKASSNAQSDDPKNGANVEPTITLEQCVICKKMINKSRKKAPKKSTVLESVNEVWDYVEAFRNVQHNNEDDIDLGRLFGTLNHYSKFEKMPCVCYFCADEVQELKDLVNFLKAKLKELRRIVIESKKHFSYSSAVQMPTLLRKTCTPSPQSTSKIVSRAQVDTQVVVSKRSLVVKDTRALPLKPPEFLSAPLSTTKQISDNLDIKAENEAEMMEWETLDNVIGEDPLALDDGDTRGNFSGDDDDDQSWNGSDAEDSSTSSELDNKRAKNSSSSDAMDAGNAADVCEDEPKKKVGSSEESEAEDEVDSCEESEVEDKVDSSDASEMEDDDKSSDKEDNVTRKSKRKSTNPYANICLKQKQPPEPKPFKCDASGCTKSFSKKDYLKFHQKNIHLDPDAKFPCTCGRIFPNAIARVKHFQTNPRHKNETADFAQRKTACDMCGVRETFAKIEAHVREHVGDYAVKCVNAPKCQYIFTTFLGLRGHLARVKSCRKVKGSKSFYEFSCGTCDFKTKNILKFRNHLSSNHERDPKTRKLQCPIPDCTEMFSVRESVHLHLHDKHNMKECRQITHQKCEECSEEIKIEEMEQHLKSGHQATQITKCKQCPFLFGSKEAFVDHLFDHRGNVEALICDICNDGIKFGRHGVLREHYYSAHQIGTKQYVCEECGKAYFTEVSLKTHLTYHDGTYDYGNKGSFRCDLCFGPTEFRTEETLIRHKITVHGEDPFRCKICGETFTSRNRFLKHKKTHLGIHMEQKVHKCADATCGMSFNKKVLLNRHIEVVHKGVRHRCDPCGKLYKDEHALKRHNEFHHLKIRPFVCETCGESFGSQQILNNHKLIHTGERPFGCTICGQRFRQKVVLKRHMDAHEKKGDSFKPNGPMKQIRKRVVK